MSITLLICGCRLRGVGRSLALAKTSKEYTPHTQAITSLVTLRPSVLMTLASRHGFSKGASRPLPPLADLYLPASLGYNALGTNDDLLSFLVESTG